MKKKPVQLELFDPDFMAEQIANVLDPGVLEDSREWPVVLAELMDIVVEHYVKREKMELDVAIENAQHVIMAIARYLGGNNAYLPRGDKLKRAIRDAAIYKAFDGFNHKNLSRKANLTSIQIYSIISKQRTIRQDRNQLKLPWG